jgi:hypothetical protein
VEAWGDDTWDQSSNEPTTNGHIAIVAGGNHCLALKTDHSIVGWGYNDYGHADPPPGGGTFASIAAGYNFSLALSQACTPPTVTGHPVPQAACEGGEATFTVTAEGTEPLSFQWRKDGNNISGATSASYTINPVELVSAGDYDVIVGNACGSSTSNTASLTVWPGVEGDLDGDCDVDEDDYDAFVACFTGPGGGPIGPECAPADFDDDDDIDCDDWTEFKDSWTGPPANPPHFLRCGARVSPVIGGSEQRQAVEPVPPPAP